MNKKAYIKPIEKQIILTNESLLMAGSNDPDIKSLDYGGDDDGNGEAEVKGNGLLWDN